MPSRIDNSGCETVGAGHDADDAYFFPADGICSDAVDVCQDFNISTPPGEDIWKKFELLLPTPPRSPSQVLDAAVEDATDTLQWVSESLDDDLRLSEQCWSLWPGKLPPGIKYELLHDCMWSGRCTESCKQRTREEDIPGSRTGSSTPIHCVRPSTPLFVNLSSSPLSPIPGALPNSVAADLPSNAIPSGRDVSSEHCVDPSSVLPYTPLSDHSYYLSSCDSGSRTAVTATRQPYHPHVASDTPSDSDDSDATTETIQKEKRLPVVKLAPPRKAAVRCGRPQKASGTLTIKFSTNRLLQKENRPGPGRPLKTRRRRRKVLLRQNANSKTRSVGRPRSKLHCTTVHSEQSSNSTSDSEDPVKRTQHNSMERKRRDDLRFAFHWLRDHIPELKENDKVPKVAILKKAANYCKELTSIGQTLERTLMAETRRKHELQKQLQLLQHGLK